MSDPRSEQRDLAARVLRAAKRDRVPGGARVRVVAATLGGLGAAPIGVAAAHGALAGGLVGHLVRGSLLAGVALLAQPGPAREIAPVAPVQLTVPRLPPPSAHVRETTPPLHAAPNPPLEPPAPTTAGPGTAAPAPTRPPPTLREEVAWLDAIRSALHAGDSTTALAELARYRRTFFPKQLAREADLLEVEALARSGDHDGARAKAHRFVRANPGTAAAKRMQGLIRPLDDEADP